MAISYTPSELGRMDGIQLRGALAEIDVELRSLVYDEDGEMRDIQRDEQADFNRLMTLRQQIEAHAAIRKAGHGRNVKVAYGGGGTRSFDADPEDSLRLGDREVRDAALRGIESRSEELSTAQGDRLEAFVRARKSGDQPYLDGAAFARRFLVTESDAYRSAFAQIMQDPFPVLTSEEAAALRAERRLYAEESRTMGEGSTAAGAAGLPILIDPSIMLQSGAGGIPIMDICRVVPTNTNVWKGVSSAPPTFSWDTAGTAVSDDSVSLTQPSITVYTTRGFIPYHLELGMDYPEFANEMAKLLNQGYTDIMASTTATGTGSAQPFGVFTKLDATAASEVLLTTNSAAGGFSAAAIFNVWNNVPERFRRNADWLMSVSVESQIRSFATTTTGQATSYFTIDMNQEGLSRLNGRPVTVTDYAPTYLSTNAHNNFLVVGDFQSYTVAQRIGGLRVETIQHLFDTTTGLPTGTRGFFAYARAGADVTVLQGLRILNQT